MAPLPILYVLDELHAPDRGGTERHVVQLVGQLDRRRFAPEMAVLRPTAFVERGEALPCPVRMLGISKLARPATLVRLMRLAAQIRRGRFRVVHVYLNDAAMVVPAFGRLAGARVVVSRRDMGFWRTPAMRRLLSLSNVFVDRIVTNSDAVRDLVQDSERCRPAQLAVLRNGLDLARFEVAPRPGLRERCGIGPEDPIVGMVANFHRWKRHRDLVRAWPLVLERHARAHLVFVGSGPQEAAVRQLAAELRVAEHVHFLGHEPDVAPVIKHFTAAVLCSESEGSSNAVLEYMACGIPVVCTDVGGNRELVRDGREGLLVRPGDVRGLADSVCLVLSDPCLCREMGGRALAGARRFSSAGMVEQHMALYEVLASAPEGLPC